MNIRILFSLAFISLSFWGSAQNHWSFDVYPKVKDPNVTDRFTKHAYVKEVVETMASVEGVETAKLGSSLEGRSIHCVKWGSGPVKVLMWSQMHGDEPTATMALLDLFRFLKNENLSPEYKEKISSELSIYMVPMLNPDGAEQYTRRTAAGVDLNRDALRLQHPEAQILKHLVDSLKPTFGFNLHDQSTYYSAGDSPLPATFSFLAPAFNYEKHINDDRTRAMQMIGSLNSFIQELIPGQVGRYSDAFEPRAFGDNITKWGAATILIECGGLLNDREKQEIRRMHFGLFLHAFECMADECYTNYGVFDYESIPENNRGLHDLILKNVTWPAFDQNLTVDIAFRRQEYIYHKKNGAGYNGQISDLGDLSTSLAYETFDMSNMMIVPPKTYPERVSAKPMLWKETTYAQALKDGFALFPTQDKIGEKLKYGPIKWHAPDSKPETSPSYGGNPTFYLAEKSSGTLRYLINNGQLFDLQEL